MQKKLLKTTLFGFSKTEVCEYITRINGEFNEKINRLTEDHGKEKAQLKAQIAQLQEEIETYKQANGDIARALFDAQTYATELKAKADAEYQAASLDLIAMKAEETEKLVAYSTKIEGVRAKIAAVLCEIDQTLQQEEAQTLDLMEEYQSEEGIAV